MMHFIDGLFQLFSHELQKATSYLKGYTRKDATLYGEEYFSLIANQHADFTEELIDLQAQKQIYVGELKTTRNEKEELINTIKNLKMDTKRLSESSNFYKAKAKKYHRHLKNKEQQEQLLLQQQQKDQQQQQHISQRKYIDFHLSFVLKH